MGGNIKTDFTDIGWDGDNWIVVLPDRDNWQTLLNTVMNLRVA
jgi:hypothetical protein